MISRWQPTSPSLLCLPTTAATTAATTPGRFRTHGPALFASSVLPVLLHKAREMNDDALGCLASVGERGLRGPSLSASPDKVNGCLSGHGPRNLLLARELRMRDPQRTQLQIRAPYCTVASSKAACRKARGLVQEYLQRGPHTSPCCIQTSPVDDHQIKRARRIFRVVGSREGKLSGNLRITQIGASPCIANTRSNTMLS